MKCARCSSALYFFLSAKLKYWSIQYTMAWTPRIKAASNECYDLSAINIRPAMHPSQYKGGLLALFAGFFNALMMYPQGFNSKGFVKNPDDPDIAAWLLACMHAMGLTGYSIRRSESTASWEIKDPTRPSEEFIAGLILDSLVTTPRFPAGYAGIEIVMVDTMGTRESCRKITFTPKVILNSAEVLRAIQQDLRITMDLLMPFEQIKLSRTIFTVEDDIILRSVSIPLV